MFKYFFIYLSVFSIFASIQYVAYSYVFLGIGLKPILSWTFSARDLWGGTFPAFPVAALVVELSSKFVELAVFDAVRFASFSCFTKTICINLIFTCSINDFWTTTPILRNKRLLVIHLTFDVILLDIVERQLNTSRITTNHGWRASNKCNFLVDVE